MSLSEGIRKVIKAPLVSMQYRPFKRARRMSLTKKSLDISVDEERWVFQWRPTLPNPIPKPPTGENVSQQVETDEKPVSEKKDPGSEPKRRLVQELLEYKPPRKFAAKDKDMMTVAPGKKKNNAEEPTRTQGRNHGYRKIRRAVRKFEHLQRAFTNDPPKGAATQ